MNEQPVTTHPEYGQISWVPGDVYAPTDEEKAVDPAHEMQQTIQEILVGTIFPRWQVITPYAFVTCGTDPNPIMIPLASTETHPAVLLRRTIQTAQRAHAAGETAPWVTHLGTPGNLLGITLLTDTWMSPSAENLKAPEGADPDNLPDEFMNLAAGFRDYCIEENLRREAVTLASMWRPDLGHEPFLTFLWYSRTPEGFPTPDEPGWMTQPGGLHGGVIDLLTELLA